MIFLTRRALALLALALASAANAQAPSTSPGPAYPNKPLRMIVPYPPGASTDAVARLVGQKMTEDMGQSVIVDNRAGASGNIGSDVVAKSTPDGYTLLLATDATHTANPWLFKSHPFDVIKDATPITMAAKNIIVLVALPTFPASNVRELIDYARKNPGKLSYGSAGQGSPHHLAGALLNQMAGIDLVHVPYKGGGPAATDLLGGQIPLVFSSLVTVAPQIRAGKLKAIAVTEKTRYSGFPNVPAVAETLPGFEMSSWLGFFGPGKLPPDILARLNASMTKALTSPDVSAKLGEAGLLVVANSPEQFAAQQKSDFEKRGQLIKAIGIQPE